MHVSLTTAPKYTFSKMVLQDWVLNRIESGLQTRLRNLACMRPFLLTTEPMFHRATLRHSIMTWRLIQRKVGTLCSVLLHSYHLFSTRKTLLQISLPLHHTYSMENKKQRVTGGTYRPNCRGKKEVQKRECMHFKIISLYIHFTSQQQSTSSQHAHPRVLQLLPSFPSPVLLIPPTAQREKLQKSTPRVTRLGSSIIYPKENGLFQISSSCFPLPSRPLPYFSYEYRVCSCPQDRNRDQKSTPSTSISKHMIKP